MVSCNISCNLKILLPAVCLYHILCNPCFFNYLLLGAWSLVCAYFLNIFFCVLYRIFCFIFSDHSQGRRFSLDTEKSATATINTISGWTYFLNTFFSVVWLLEFSSFIFRDHSKGRLPTQKSLLKPLSTKSAWRYWWTIAMIVVQKACILYSCIINQKLFCIYALITFNEPASSC